MIRLEITNIWGLSCPGYRLGPVICSLISDLISCVTPAEAIYVDGVFEQGVFA